MTRLIPVLGYALGSFLPADYIVSSLIRGAPPDYGENYGTAATWRLVGPLPALVVFAYDFSKGLFPVLLAHYFSAPPLIIVLSAAAPVLGHNWPVLRGFRGGRGMAASVGAVVYLAPEIFIPSFAVGGVVALFKRRTPWVAYVGLPLGLGAALYVGIPRHELIAVVLLGALLLLRQIQWGDWS
jgi:glycerol-3-phosphate acyltransferase PlsY